MNKNTMEITLVDENRTTGAALIGKVMSRLHALKHPPQQPVLRSTGHCPACDRDTTFTARSTWLRDHFLCEQCGSLPRERALMSCVESFYPDWQQLTIHESSPGSRGASARLSRECKHYVPSQYYPDKEPGSKVGAYRCENLEKLTFDNESIDLHITQDVLEHVFDPEMVFSEIARTLKPGGAHIFTVPMVNKQLPTKVRARLREDGSIMEIEPPVYHGNPISDQGSLVTIDWGFDICKKIFDACGLFTHLIYIDDLSRGIRAEYIEVLVTMKPGEDEQLRDSER
jgi:SAM-dependent methyltransferase